MRFPPERTREYIRARWWAWRYRTFTLKRDLPIEMRPFLLTGPPRSGTSLLSSLLDSVPNVISLNEPNQIMYRRMFDADPCTLVRGTAHWAARLAISHGYVINKVDPDKPDQVTTDTWNRGGKWARVPIDFDRHQPIVVGMKAPLPLVSFMDTLCDGWNALRAVIIVRDPVATVNSWRNAYGWQHGFEDQKAGAYWPLYDRVPRGLSPIETRAHIWRVIVEECLAQAAKRPERVCLLRYEHLLRAPAETMVRLAHHLGCPEPEAEIDVSFVKPQRRPSYKNLNEEEVAIIREVCAPVVAQLDDEQEVPQISVAEVTRDPTHIGIA